MDSPEEEALVEIGYPPRSEMILRVSASREVFIAVHIPCSCGLGHCGENPNSGESITGVKVPSDEKDGTEDDDGEERNIEGDDDDECEGDDDCDACEGDNDPVASVEGWDCGGCDWVCREVRMDATIRLHMRRA